MFSAAIAIDPHLGKDHYLNQKYDRRLNKSYVRVSVPPHVASGQNTCNTKS